MADLSNFSGISPAYVSVCSSGTGPGVVVLHPWWGVNSFVKSACEFLAQAGFVAAAPDLYDGAVAEAIQDAELLMRDTDFETSLRTIIGTVNYLKAHPSVTTSRIGVVGFSMGAAWAMRLSVVDPANITAVVLFYGTEEGDFTLARAAYQGHFAYDDPYEAPEYVRKLEETLRADGHIVQFYHYPGTRHWFMEDNRPEYDPDAAGLAWERALLFLHLKLGDADEPPV